MTNRSAQTAALALMIVATTSARDALAQPAGAARSEQPSAPPPTTQPGLQRYAELSFGFEMQLPSGWSYDRTRYSGPGGALGLLRGRSMAARATLQVLIYRTLEEIGFERWVDAFAEAIASGPDTKLLGKHRLAVAGRDATVFEIDVKPGNELTKSYYCCVPFDPSTIWVLVYGGVVVDGGDGANRDSIRQQCEALAGTLKILSDGVDRDEIARALATGKRLLDRLSADGRDISLDEQTRYYEIILDGKPFGYLSRQMLREARALDAPGGGRSRGGRKDGLRVRERTWQFAADGTATYTRVDLFASFDQESELIEQEQTVVPPETAVAPKPITSVDQVIREGDVLFSSARTSLDARYPTPRAPLKIGKCYLGLAWTRVMPMLLGDQPSELSAFAVYDSQTRALITHLVKPLGPRPLPDGTDKSSRAYETREAFASAPALVYTDKAGIVLRIEAGELVLQRISEKIMEERYATRRDAARKRSKAELAGERP